MKTLLVIILLVLTACSPIPTTKPGEHSILADSNCTLPCWHGITPGSTTKQELLQVLSGLPLVNQDSITVTRSVNEAFDEYVEFTMGEGPVYLKQDQGAPLKQDYVWSGTAALRNDRVLEIDLRGDLGLTFGGLVDRFGEPTYLIPSPTPGLHIWVEALDPSKGLDFGYRADDEDSEITPGTPITGILLFDPASYQELTAHQTFLYQAHGPRQIEAQLWKGYGKIRMYWPAE
ncbi:MAG TPA: hypothetical protein VK249_33560 [Anaerolineales bacterium]|nr:hypothetical protein [Anaerolineales bacterium]